MRIEEIVNSLTTASTPSIPSKVLSQTTQKKEFNNNNQETISNTASLFIDQIFTSSNQTFQTPVKTKHPNSLSFAPLKEKSKDTPLSLIKSNNDDDTVRLASPLF